MHPAFKKFKHMNPTSRYLLETTLELHLRHGHIRFEQITFRSGVERAAVAPWVLSPAIHYNNIYMYVILGVWRMWSSTSVSSSFLKITALVLKNSDTRTI